MNFSAKASFSGLNLSVAQAAFEQAARLSVEQGAEAVLETAESIVPVDRGELRESGRIQIIQASGSKPSAAAIFDAPHAGYVEYGTGERGAASAGAYQQSTAEAMASDQSFASFAYSANWPGMVSQPYLRPALDIERPAIVEIFRDNVAAAAKTLGRSSSATAVGMRPSAR